MTDVLDMEVVDELLSLTGDEDPELLLDLIGMFLEDAPIKLSAILHGLASGDFEALSGAVHSLKGSAGNLGAHVVQHDCESLQHAGRSNNKDVARELIPNLEQHFAEALEALEALQQKYG